MSEMSDKSFEALPQATKDLSGTQSFGIPRMLPGGGPTTLHSKINVEPLSHDDGGSYAPVPNPPLPRLSGLHTSSSASNLIGNTRAGE